MTKDNIVEAAKIINNHISKGDSIILENDYKKELLSLVDRDTMMEMGCLFVKGFRNYIELPPHEVTEARVNAISLLRGD